MTSIEEGISVEVQSLVNTTGTLLADRTVQDILQVFAHALPHAIWSCYVEGSYANQSAVATSDLDLVIVLHAPISTIHEQRMVATLLETCQQRSPLELDITVTDKLQLQQAADPLFKPGARLLFGPEIRGHDPSPANHALGATTHARRVLAYDSRLSTITARHCTAHRSNT